MTSLASIIGSGFLVIAPMLGVTVGGAAPWAMLAIVVAGYAIGAIIRFNIRYAEPRLATAARFDRIVIIERASNIALTVGYVVSVAFYLRILSAFILRGLAIDSDVAATSLTTALLCLIAFIGWRQGLHGLERLEKYSVTIKLCIIAAMLFGLGHFDIFHGMDTHGLDAESRTAWDVARILGGMLLVVQGFETSRYMGDEYSADDRVTGMRSAQILAAIIYVSFIFLITPLLHWVDQNSIDETSVIDLAANVAIVLPAMLIVAAVMSQFSAAVADTVGAGGLVAEESGRRLPARAGYLLVCGLAVVLVWVGDVFEIISLASRAFAAYYFVQSLLAIQVMRDVQVGPRRWFSLASLGLAAAGLLWIVIFAKAVN